LKILELKKLSNDLEASAYELRRVLEEVGSNPKILSDAERDKYESEINSTIDWIYDESKPQPVPSDFTSRQEHIQTIAATLRSQSDVN
jgi:hypothetical protein